MLYKFFFFFFFSSRFLSKECLWGFVFFSLAVFVSSSSRLDVKRTLSFRAGVLDWCWCFVFPIGQELNVSVREFLFPFWLSIIPKMSWAAEIFKYSSRTHTHTLDRQDMRMARTILILLLNNRDSDSFFKRRVCVSP